jgi:hypothetical protein
MRLRIRAEELAVNDGLQKPVAPQASSREGIAISLICLAVGVYCITFPEAILDGAAFAEVPKRSFGTACGLLFVGGAIGLHAYDWWGRRGFARVSVIGRLIATIMGLGAFAHMLKCIYDVDGWPW